MVLRERSQINSEETWSIDEMYPIPEVLEEDFNKLESLLAEFATLKGTLTVSVEALLTALQLRDRIKRLSSNLYAYSRMKKDEDNSISDRRILYDRATTAFIRVDSVLSFLVPELLETDEKHLLELIQDTKLSDYRVYINELLRRKVHTLSALEEGVLALTGEIAVSYQNIFTMLNNADIKFGKIRNEHEEEIELTKANFLTFLESPNRLVRKNAYETLYKSYRALKNTFSSIMVASFKKDSFFARARNYKSVLEMALDEECIPNTVFNKLLEGVRKNLYLLHRYSTFRKKILGLNPLRYYDMYVKLGKSGNDALSYEDAVKLVQNGLKPLGVEYGKIIRKGFGSRWIDVYEIPGKTSGAYSWGTYDSKPYILLNYQGNRNYILTIAHEIGHSIHSYLSREKQPYINSEYKKLLAEVASTVNEIILMESLLTEESNDVEKLFLLNHYLEQFRGKVYRATMLSEFENTVRNMIHQEEQISTEWLCKYYLELLRDYYGSEVELDHMIQYEWMRNQHLYTPFSAYKYATGFSAALVISHRILTEGDCAINDYLKFLSLGGAEHPIELLKLVGVDLTSIEVVSNALGYFGEIIERAEILAEKVIK